MSMLTEKRQEVINQILALNRQRDEEIRAKVAAYENQLRAQVVETPEFKRLNEIVEALDKVIAFEKANTPEVEAQPAKVEPVPAVKAEPAVEGIPTSTTQEVPCTDTIVEQTIVGDVATSRPGMVNITTPERG